MKETQLGHLRVSSRVTFIISHANEKVIEAAASCLTTMLAGELDQVRITYSQSVRYVYKAIALTPNCEVSGHLYSYTEADVLRLKGIAQDVGNLHGLPSIEITLCRVSNFLFEKD